ncbi:MAG: cyclase family protein [Ilumatobacteraceae bacterium]
MTTTDLLNLVSAGLRVYDLARPYQAGMAQSPNHPPYRHAYTRRHGDAVRNDGGSAAADIIVLGTHVGTHIDALGHVSHDGYVHGGTAVADLLQNGLDLTHGVDTFASFVNRGVLLDVPATLGVEACEPGYEITVDDLERTVERQGTSVGEGDVALIRSGWGRNFSDSSAFVGQASGVPGPSAAAASWLAERRVVAAGADTIAFERLAPGAGHASLPAHRILLVESGINIIETMVLDEIARDEVHEFMLVLAPLPLVGATGSPLRPLAIVGASS